MPTASKDALLRIVNMMQLIPVYPRWTTAKSLHQAIKSRGFEVTRRTIERNLNDFSQVFGLISNDSPEGYKWSFRRDSQFSFVPAMSVEEALSLKMAQKHLQLHMPHSVFETLDGVFKKSDEILKHNKQFHQWHDKIAVIPPGINVKTKQIAPDIAEVLYKGLLEGKIIRIRYKSFKRPFNVKLLGMIIRSNKLVLPCIFEEYGDERMILAHRIKEASLTSFQFNHDFDVQAYADSEAPGNFVSEGEIQLEFHCKGFVTTLLQESELGKNQRLSPIDDTWSKCTVTLKHTYELEHWLQGHIQYIRIISPDIVKNRVKAHLLAGLEYLEQTCPKDSV